MRPRFPMASASTSSSRGWPMRALGLEQQIGTLEEGKLADFVVLDGDPLAHIGDTLRIVAVAQGGVWREQASLLAPR